MFVVNAAKAKLSHIIKSPHVVTKKKKKEGKQRNRQKMVKIIFKDHLTKEVLETRCPEVDCMLKIKMNPFRIQSCGTKDTPLGLLLCRGTKVKKGPGMLCQTLA